MKKDARSRELGELWRNTRPQRAKATCFNPACNERTSKNHLLMKNGIVKEISGHTRHVRELRTNRHRDLDYYFFERIGYDDALTMYGYCSKCDYRLFSPIEDPLPQIPTSLESACRYGLRPVLHEIRKKEGNLKFFPKLSRLENGFLFQAATVSPEEIERFGIESLKKIYAAIDAGIRGASDLDYCVVRTERQEVCASSVLLRPRLFFGPLKHKFLSGDFNLDIISFNVINIFPTNEELVVTSIANKRDIDGMRFNQKLSDSAPSELRMMLSDILIGQIEDWAVSEALFARFPYGLDRIISKAKHNSAEFYLNHEIDLFSTK